MICHNAENQPGAGAAGAEAEDVQSLADTTDGPSANRPRLIVSWKDPAPLITSTGAQLRYRGDPDDMTPWKYGEPNGAMLSMPLSQLCFNQIRSRTVFLSLRNN